MDVPANRRLGLVPAAIAALLLITAAPAAAKKARCLTPDPAVVTSISAGLAPGISLTNVQAVRSRDFEKVFFVSGELDGSGLEATGHIATWALNDITTVGGLVYSVGGLARQFSDWARGEPTDAEVSLTDHGAKRSQSCVKNLADA